MNVKIVTKNFVSNAGVFEMVQKELERVERMFSENTIFDVCIKKTVENHAKTIYKCDITIKNGKHFVRGYGESNIVQCAVDSAVDSLKRKARKAKTFAMKKRREYEDFIDPLYQAETEPIEKVDFSINRVKNIETNVMSSEEAIAQMELLGHNFFVYKNENGFVSVLYKREVGYGVIIAS